MKFKFILLMLSATLIFSFTPKHFSFINENALTLSKDEGFCEMFNSMMNFTFEFRKENKHILLNDYASGKISKEGLSEIVKLSGLQSTERVKQFFSNITKTSSNLHERYTFLNNKEKALETIREALVLAAKDGKFSKVVKLPEDCLISLTAALAICYAAYDNCWAGGGGDYCVALWAACLTLAWNSYDQCIGAA